MALTATLAANPWRFATGDEVFIAGHPQFAAKVTAAFGHGRSGWPHYVVVDYEGLEWTVPQQVLSRSPILP
jgi:hypothetical protein